jgi:hypothetical protein
MLVAFIWKVHISSLGPGPDCPQAFVILIRPSGESPEEHLELANNHFLLHHFQLILLSPNSSHYNLS